ncbi:MAG: hydantoinase/oxoprolinase family protein [Pseudomonadota bacterium]
MAGPQWSVGIDTGGTFTDVYAVDLAGGATLCAKTPSTPDDPSRAILKGLQILADDLGVDLSHLLRLAHGTTVGTNALIQRTGGRVGLLVTRGFVDLPAIGRQTRPRIFDLQTDAPPPLAGPELRFEITERVLADGSVLRPLAMEEVPALAEAIRASGAEALSICLLFSFLNPNHEQRLREALSAELPDLRISLSSEVQPEFREYERLNTTLINGYLQSVMEGYIDRLDSGVEALAPQAGLGINQSSGGLMTASLARSFPVRTALSGPAAGAVGAAYVARQVGRQNVLTVDVGGTSADVALIVDYRPGIAREREVAGFPIRLPMVDIETIGAGGGSIAWFDIDGLLKVGPRSAGAHPGPACYGEGGTEATVSDANLVLGRLGGDLANGGLNLRPDLARDAIAPLAQRLDCKVEEAALSILQIVVSNMVRVLRSISVERGHDPTSFALMPFGGAGPLHARDIAVELGIGEIIVPAAPGIVCAQGLLVADRREDFSATRRLLLAAENKTALDEALAGLDGAAEAWLSEAEAAPEACRKELVVEARYEGQNFELQVPAGRFGQGAAAAFPEIETFRTAFLDEHRKAYGYANPEAPVEVINLRLTAFVAGLDLTVAKDEPADGHGRTAERQVWFDASGPITTRIYHRGDLAAEQRIPGPAIIEQLDTTIPIYPGDVGVLDHHGNLIITLGGEA